MDNVRTELKKIQISEEDFKDYISFTKKKIATISQLVVLLKELPKDAKRNAMNKIIRTFAFKFMREEM
jgi:hypothetical protein